MKYEEARTALSKMLQEGREGPYYSLEEVEAHIREMFKPENLIYVTGDAHGDFSFLKSFIERTTPIEGSTFILLGDVVLNYYGDRRDLRGKELLGGYPYTFFCLHGTMRIALRISRPTMRSRFEAGSAWWRIATPISCFRSMVRSLTSADTLVL